MEDRRLKNLWIVVVLIIIVLAVIGWLLFSGYKKITLINENIESFRQEMASTTEKLGGDTIILAQSLDALRLETTGISNTLSFAQQNIDAVKNQVGGVEQTVGSISGKVGTLQKLALTDPELLKKYSKVYFMNENYTPAHLTDVPNEYLYSEKNPEQFLSESWPYLKAMIDTAKRDGVELYVKSGYRSFGEQQSLKSLYKVVYGAGTANTFSADQGYSEHQLGTTVDLITTGLNGQLEGFDKTKAYTWLKDNAYRFGFVLSYPENNNYYVFEPWHWRFVGTKLAGYIHNQGINFYDMDQRDIDKYLADTFD